MVSIMFSGIVQCTAKVVSIKNNNSFYTHVIQLPENLLYGLKLGASIAHNGCCLTISEINNNYISFDIIQETLKLTNLIDLSPGDMVNIERSAKFSDEIGGHIMSGHIVTIATVYKIINYNNTKKLWFKINSEKYMKYFFHKGFIGVDGVSLTICDVTKNMFSVNLIPETLKRTLFNKVTLNKRVNLEINPIIQSIVDTVERILK